MPYVYHVYCLSCLVFVCLEFFVSSKNKANLGGKNTTEAFFGLNFVKIVFTIFKLFMDIEA